MDLTSERSKFLPYSFPLYQYNYALIYKNVEAIPPNLGLFTTGQMHVWIGAAILAIISAGIKWTLRRWFNEHGLSRRYILHQNLILGFFFGVFLRYVSTQLTVLFTEINKPIEPFTRGNELIEKLESKEYSMAYYYQSALKFYANPVQYMGKTELYDRLIAAHQHNQAVSFQTLGIQNLLTQFP